jgi:hypothetical protein
MQFLLSPTWRLASLEWWLAAPLGTCILPGSGLHRACPGHAQATMRPCHAGRCETGPALTAPGKNAQQALSPWGGAPPSRPTRPPTAARHRRWAGPCTGGCKIAAGLLAWAGKQQPLASAQAWWGSSAEDAKWARRAAQVPWHLGIRAIAVPWSQAEELHSAGAHTLHHAVD